jgi:hypothetical protein
MSLMLFLFPISGVNSQIRPWIVNWLENNKPHSTKILLHVTLIRNWKVKTHVDAVTSASSKKDAKKLASEYAQMIKTRLSELRESMTLLLTKRGVHRNQIHTERFD